MRGGREAGTGRLSWQMDPKHAQGRENMEKSGSRNSLILAAGVVVTVALGQAAAYLLAPDSWRGFVARLPIILSMIAFWGPIVALIAAGCVWVTMRLLGFHSWEEIRTESVEQNN